MKYWLKVILFSLFWTGVFLSSASADVYKYQNKDGNVVFTDHVMGLSHKLIWRSQDAWSKKKRSSTRRFDMTHYRRNKEKYRAMINTAAKKAGVSAALLHALVRAESSYDAKALSSAGAKGLAQLMPATAKRYGVTNINNPKQNIEAGARYLKDLLAMFKQNKHLALAGYNAGENAVKKYGNKIPPYPETRRYVVKVMKFYQENLRSSGKKVATISKARSPDRIVPMLISTPSGKVVTWTNITLDE